MPTLSRKKRDLGWGTQLMWCAENCGGSRNIYQPVANGVDDELCGLVNAECVHDIGTVDGNGVHAEFELSGDFLVGFAVADKLQNLHFARGQARTSLPLKTLLEGKLTVEHGFAIHHAPNGGPEFKIQRILQHVTFCTGFKSLADPGVLGM